MPGASATPGPSTSEDPARVNFTSTTALAFPEVPTCPTEPGAHFPHHLGPHNYRVEDNSPVTDWETEGHSLATEEGPGTNGIAQALISQAAQYAVRRQHNPGLDWGTGRHTHTVDAWHSDLHLSTSPLVSWFCIWESSNLVSAMNCDRS